MISKYVKIMPCLVALHLGCGIYAGSSPSSYSFHGSPVIDAYGMGLYGRELRGGGAAAVAMVALWGFHNWRTGRSHNLKLKQQQELRTEEELTEKAREAREKRRKEAQDTENLRASAQRAETEKNNALSVLADTTNYWAPRSIHFYTCKSGEEQRSLIDRFVVELHGGKVGSFVHWVRDLEGKLGAMRHGVRVFRERGTLPDALNKSQSLEKFFGDILAATKVIFNETIIEHDRRLQEAAHGQRLLDVEIDNRKKVGDFATALKDFTSEARTNMRKITNDVSGLAGDVKDVVESERLRDEFHRGLHRATRDHVDSLQPLITGVKTVVDATDTRSKNIEKDAKSAVTTLTTLRTEEADRGRTITTTLGSLGEKSDAHIRKVAETAVTEALVAARIQAANSVPTPSARPMQAKLLEDDLQPGLRPVRPQPSAPRMADHEPA